MTTEEIKTWLTLMVLGCIAAFMGAIDGGWGILAVGVVITLTCVAYVLMENRRYP